MAQERRVIVWAPNSNPQRMLLSCPVFEVFFGGARGGGKSESILGEWAQHSNTYGKDAIGLVVRRNSKQLGELFERAKTIFTPIGSRLTGTPESGGMNCVMINGARLKFAHLERDSDAENYQGQNLTRLYVEEAGNFPSPAPIMRLMATLRSGAGVPCRVRLTGNPGGPGHQWLKARYIDPAPRGMEIITDPETGLERVYIPSRVTDNPALGPEYIAQLKASGSPELVRAWLEGDWSVIAGAFFPEFDMARHVVAPRSLPAYWHRFRSFDWGSARPFSVGWWAVSDGELPEFPRGALIRYREWYGMPPGKPNTGLRLTAEEVADGIKQRERDELHPIVSGVADPAIFAEDGGPSIAHRMAIRGVSWRAADNARVARAGAMGGWDQVRARLKGDGERPAIYFFSTCIDTIRTLPALQHDESRPEDLCTEMEDHAADECLIENTKINTKRGHIKIKDITVSDMVMTRNGYKNVTACFTNGYKDVYEIRLSNGNTIVGTANHPIYVEGIGFIPLIELRYGDIMSSCKSLSLAKRCRNSMVSGITDAVPIIGGVVSFYIGWCGRRITDAYRKVLIFTTGIWTETIISQKTLLAFPHSSILLSMESLGRLSPLLFLSSTRGHRLRNGIGQRQAMHGINFITKSTAKKFFMYAYASGARIANKNSLQLSMVNFVPMPVSLHQGGSLDQIMLKEYAKHVGPPLWQIDLQKSNIVHYLVHVLGLMKEKSFGSIAFIVGCLLRRKTGEQCTVRCVVDVPMTVGRQRVYNLSVEDAEEYFANGVLVHNCRYACMSRAYTAPLPEEARDRDRYARSPKRRKKGAMAA